MIHVAKMLKEKELEVNEREALIERLLASGGLRRAEKLGKLLQFLHANSHGSSGAALSEKEIGAKIFPRPDRGEAADDSIVRVSVRQLRFKLHDYFSGEGAGEPWVVEIPKGEYRLQFRERAAETADSRKGATRRESYLFLAGGLAAGSLVGVLGAHWNRRASQYPRNLLARCMADGRYSMTLVPGDASYRFWLSQSIKEPTLTQYIEGKLEPSEEVARNPAAQGLYRWLGRNKTISAEHAASMSRLMAAMGGLASRVAVKHPRDLPVRELHQNSFVFLAARYKNPIVDLFEPRLTLRCDNNSLDATIGVVDALAKAGEKKRYAPEEPRDGVSYARIALLPNLGSDGGRVLLLSGLGPVGTEAAAIFASSEEWLEKLLAALPPGVEYFEALVEAQAFNMTPVGLRLLIARGLEGKR